MPEPKREQVLAALFAACEAAAAEGGGTAVRNSSATLDEVRRPAVLLFDGDEGEPLAWGNVGRGASCVLQAEPVVLVAADVPSGAEPGPTANQWLARLQRHVFGSAALRAAAGRADTHPPRQMFVRLDTPPGDPPLVLVTLGLAIPYTIDPTNPDGSP